MSEDITLVVRAINLVLAMICFIWLLLKASKYWSAYHGPTKLYIVALLGFTLSMLYGSGEALALHVEGGSRIYLATASVVCMLYALWKTRGVAMTGQGTDPKK